MANVKISGLSTGSAAETTGNSVVAVVAGGDTKQLSITDLTTVVGGGGSSVDTALIYSGSTNGIVPQSGSNSLSTGSFSAIVGGCNNTVVGGTGTIVGGRNNCATMNNSTSTSGVTVFGVSNTSSAVDGGTTISGCYNSIGECAYDATIGGGYQNRICQFYSTIAGGSDNVACGGGSFIGGGFRNCVSKNSTLSDSGYYSAIGGGSNNCIISASSYTFIGGGDNNNVSSSFSGILGGTRNSVTHPKSFIVGSDLTSSRDCTTHVNDLIISTFSACNGCTVTVGTNGLLEASTGSGGGVTSIIAGSGISIDQGTGDVTITATGGGGSSVDTALIYSGSVVRGIVPVSGSGNYISGSDTAILNGSNNTISFGFNYNDGKGSGIQPNIFTTIVGGCSNTTDSYTSVIAGGCCNRIFRSPGASINGGANNIISASIGGQDGWNAIGGGSAHCICNAGRNNTIAGGLTNKICNAPGLGMNTIGGGCANRVDGSSVNKATISGGTLNVISIGASCGFIGGGSVNSVGGRTHAVVVGGCSNSSTYSAFGFIGGGCDNCIAYTNCSIIGGGYRNCAHGSNYSGIGIFSGMCNTAADCNIALSLGVNNYSVPALTGASGSFSAIMGGARNTIFMNSASVYNNDYSLAPNFIGGGIDNEIRSEATNTCSAYWTYTGGNVIVGGTNNKITGSSCSGNYPLGSNFIGGGSINTICQIAGTNSGSYNYLNNIVGGLCNTIGNASNSTIGGSVGMNFIAGGYNNKILSHYNDNVSSNAILGIRNNTIQDVQCSTVIGYQNRIYGMQVGGSGNIIASYSSTIQSATTGAASNFNTIIGGNSHNMCCQGNTNTVIGGSASCITGSGATQSSVIASAGGYICGVCFGSVIASQLACVNHERAIILGGFNICTRATSSVHMPNILLETGSLPTADPGIVGMLYRSGTDIKISLG